MTRGTVRLSMLGTRNDDPTNFGGELRAEADARFVFTEGTGDGQINRIFDAVALVVPPAGLEIALDTMATKPDATLAAALIKGLQIEADALNTGEIIVGPGTIDPWLGLWDDAASGIRLSAGEVHSYTSNVGWAVAGGSRSIKFLHGEGTDQWVHLTILASTV